MQFKIFDKYIIVLQKSYIWQTLKIFGYSNIDTYATPVISNFYDEVILRNNDELIDEDRYRAMIETLLFLPWPDISTAVGILSLCSHHPVMFLKNYIKIVYGYLKQKGNFEVNFASKSDSISYLFHADSIFAGKKSNRKSRSDWDWYTNDTLFLGNTRKQDCVSLSTAEADYIVLSE